MNPLALFLTPLLWTTPEQELTPEMLGDRLAQWTRNGIQDYRMEIQRRCFCTPGATGRISVFVQGGVIYGACYAEDVDAGGWELSTPLPTAGDPVGWDDGRYMVISVSGLFEILGQALALEAASVVAEFDPTLGFPTQIRIDYSTDIADEESGYQVIALEPYPPLGSFDTQCGREPSEEIGIEQ